MYRTSNKSIRRRGANDAVQKATPSNRLDTSRYNKNEKLSLLCTHNNFMESVDRKDSEANQISKDSLNIMPKNDLLNFNTNRRSNGRLLKNLQNERRDGSYKTKNVIPNLPVLNKNASK